MQRQKDVPLLFYSYANVEADKSLLKDLESHLGTVIQKGAISGWHEGKIGAGIEWAKQIEDYLNKAAIILLLISPDFFAPEYHPGIEEVTRRAMERSEQREARVIPILLRPVDWHDTPFAKLKPLPKDGKFVTQWANKDEAFFAIAQGIREAVENITTPNLLPEQEPSSAKPDNTSATAPLSPPSSPPTQRPDPNTLSRREFLKSTGLIGIGGVLGAVGGVEITLLTKHASLTEVQMIMTPSSFSGGLPDAELPLLRDALSAVFELPVAVPVVGESYMDSITRFGRGEFNVFWASDYAYVIAKAKYGALPILRRKNLLPDDPYYYSYILTRASSKISRLADLKGKKLSYVDPHSTSGYLFPRYAMSQIGLDDVHTNYALSHKESLRSIFNGSADACAVSSEFYKSKDGVYKSQYYTEFLQEYHVPDSEIISIYRSEPLFTPPVVVHPDISEDDKRKLQNGFLFLQDPTLLGQLGIAGFGSVADEEYNPVRHAAQVLGIDLQNPNP